MRQTPVSQLKHQTNTKLREVPKEGSRLRELYDMFQANKGQVISWSRSHRGGYSNGRLLEDLVDYYGLDIRRIKNGRWCLVGEWFGKVYVDYVAEKIK